MIRRFIEAFRFAWRGGENDMIMLYALNVVKGTRFFSKISPKLQPFVKEQLEIMDLDPKFLQELLAK